MLGYTIIFAEGVSIILNEESIIGTIVSISYNLSVSCNSESVTFKFSVVFKLEHTNYNVESISWNFESTSCKLVYKLDLSIICKLFYKLEVFVIYKELLKIQR